MKSSDFFRQLHRELEDAAPPMSDALKNEPIRTAPPEGEAETPAPPEKRVRAPKRRRLIATLSAAAAVFVACVVGITASLSGAPSLPAQTYAYMYMDINPSVALTLDENYNVRRVLSRNADGDTIAGDKAFVASLVGLNAKDAAVKVAERAAKSGYISLRDEGSDGLYNEISVTIKSDGEAAESTVSEIKEGLVEYFCDKGVYVYVNASAETDPDAKAQTEALEARPDAYFEWLAESGDLAELETLTEETIYDYAADLLKDALHKYDLFGEIETLNEQIKADSDNTFRLGYWLIGDELRENDEEIRDLSLRMSRCLEELFLLYGTDCRERSVDSLARYTAAHAAYVASTGAADVGELRALSEAGLSAETFGGIKNLSVRVNYFYFVTNDVLNSVAGELWNVGSSPTLEKLTKDIGTLVEDRTKALTERYSALFSLERERIDEGAYEEFLKRIGK